MQDGFLLIIPFVGMFDLLPKSLREKIYPKSYPNSYRDKRYIPTPFSEAANNLPYVGRYVSVALGGFHPMLPIYKEIQDSLTRYKSLGLKSRSHLVRDVLLPVRALGNILVGIATVVAGVLLTLEDLSLIHI